MAEQIDAPQPRPILRSPEPHLRSQPVQIAPAVGPPVPKPLGHLLKAPLQPLIFWQVVFEQREKRVAERLEEPPAAMRDQLILSEAVPVFGTVVAQLLPQPVKI